MSFLKKKVEPGKALADVIPGLGRLTFDPSLGTTFITSGTGVIGYRVAMSLLEAGHTDVRVGIWFGDREVGEGAGDKTFAQNIADILEQKGATVIPFNWADEKDYENALKGINTVFCTLPHMDEWASVFPAFLKKCKEKKVEHFVKISFLENIEASDKYRKEVPFVKFHTTCDDILKQAPSSSRISYTILGTSHLMPTPLLQQGDTLSKDHKFVTASYGMGVNYVSPNDVADCAVVVLMDLKKHRNKTYNLTGARPTLDRDVAKLLTKAYGTEIKHIEMGYHDYVRHVKQSGLPSWLVKDAAAFEKMKASGVDELVSSYTDDIHKLTGRFPETFEDYLFHQSSQRPGKTFPILKKDNPQMT